MSRPRLRDADLPARLHLRRGTYFYVRRNRWINLGKDRAGAIYSASAYKIPPTPTQEPILKYAWRALTRARQNAKGRRGLEFTLTRGDVQSMLEDANWRCAVTGTPFVLDRHGEYGDRPFAPSIDRIDSSRGYTPGNCRIVCVAVNFAMNRWGEAVLLVLLDHMKSLDSIRQSK